MEFLNRFFSPLSSFLSNKWLHGMKISMKNVLLKVSSSRFDSLTKFFSRHQADDVIYIIVIVDGNTSLLILV